MKISFVVPVFKKRPETLRRCIKSLVGQSHKDIQIIVVFDGHDEELSQVVREFPDFGGHDKKHLVCGLSKQSGASAARNFGASYAKGDYVAFWDADCFAAADMAKTWCSYLEKFKCDFVYSGYKFDDVNVKGFDSEEFDPWTLERFNYIASMFPLKRELVQKWDESLSGLQDWDYWRRVVAKGARGVYIPTAGVSYPFTTEIPGKDSISGQTDKRLERLSAIKAKFSDKEADILVLSASNRQTAIELAKSLDADYFNGLFWKTRNYKAVILVGADLSDPAVFQMVVMSPPSQQVIIYWMGPDAELFSNDMPFKVVKALKELIDKANILNLCDDLETKRVLESLGITAEQLHLPVRDNSFAAPLPPEFKCLVYCDQVYDSFVDSLLKAIPDVKLEKVEQGKPYNMADYTCVVQLTAYHRLLPSTRAMLLAGRYVISNIKEPYCGYISLDQELDDYKREFVKAVRDLRAVSAINAEAQEFYRGLTDPQTFKESLSKLIRKPALEII